MGQPLILWVYGSLRRGEQHQDELQGAEFLGSASTLPRYALLRRGDYPALVAGDEVVAGELYRVSAALLERLDAFEGPGYRRAAVLLQDGREAQAYFAAG